MGVQQQTEVEVDVATEGLTRIHIKAQFKDTPHRFNTSILNRAQLITFAHLTGGLVPSLVDANHAFGAGGCSVGADNIVVALGAKQLAGSRRG